MLFEVGESDFDNIISTDFVKSSAPWLRNMRMSPDDPVSK
jgi:hypothetical protein